MDDPRRQIEECRELLAGARPAPWVWLDSDGSSEDEGDELQDGHGEYVAGGFSDDIVLDGKRLTTDGRLCALLRNIAPDLLEALAASESQGEALDVETLKYDSYMRGRIAGLQDAFIKVSGLNGDGYFEPSDPALDAATQAVRRLLQDAKYAALKEQPGDDGDVMPNECPSCGTTCNNRWHHWAPGGEV